MQQMAAAPAFGTGQTIRAVETASVAGSTAKLPARTAAWAGDQLHVGEAARVVATIAHHCPQ